MNVLQLPSDILITIFNNMQKDVLHSLTVNKEINNILKERMVTELDKYKRKLAFFTRMKEKATEGSTGFYWYAFNFVTTVEECEFLRERYSSEYDNSTFIGSVKYTINNTYQVSAETWTLYLQIYD